MDSWEVVSQMRCVLLGVFQEAEPELELLGLQVKTYVLLASLPRFPFPATLAKQLFLPPPTVTFLVKQLEKNKLITRDHETGDLRRYRLRLTAKGTQSVDAGKDVIARIMKKRLAHLSKQQAKDFAATLKILQELGCPPAKVSKE